EPRLSIRSLRVPRRRAASSAALPDAAALPAPFDRSRARRLLRSGLSLSRTPVRNDARRRRRTPPFRGRDRTQHTAGNETISRANPARVRRATDRPGWVWLGTARVAGAVLGDLQVARHAGAGRARAGDARTQCASAASSPSPNRTFDQRPNPRRGADTGLESDTHP